MALGRARMQLYAALNDSTPTQVHLLSPSLLYSYGTYIVFGIIYLTSKKNYYLIYNYIVYIYNILLCTYNAQYCNYVI